MKCTNCVFHTEYIDMGAWLDCCRLHDDLANSVRACDNSDNCKKRLTIDEAKKIVEARDVMDNEQR